MPPKRSEFSQQLAKEEGRILLALDDIETGRINLCAQQRSYTIYYSLRYKTGTDYWDILTS